MASLPAKTFRYSTPYAPRSILNPGRKRPLINETIQRPPADIVAGFRGLLAHDSITCALSDCMGRFNAMTSLVLWKARKPFQVPWTEYSLYTSVAEISGTLFDYHAEWDTCYTSDVQLFSEQSCVWGADDFERLVRLTNGTDPGGKFIIVQSHARIPLQQVRDYCLSFAG